MPGDAGGQRIVRPSRVVDRLLHVEHRLHAGRIEGQNREADAVPVHLGQPLAVEIDEPPLEDVRLSRHRVLRRFAQRVFDREVLFQRDLAVHTAANSLRLSPYSRLSTSACRLASMMFSFTPIVVHDEAPSLVSISTRVTAAVPDDELTMRTL